MVILTGSDGFIGSHLLRRLKRQGENVHCFDISHAAPAKYAIPYIDKAKIVFHLSCLTQERCESFPTTAWQTNAWDTKAIAEACAQHGVPLIYTSSCSVYGQSTTRHEESSLPKPLSTYGITKLAGEQFIRATPGLEYAILRLSNVYGPGQTPVNNLYCGFIGKAFYAASLGKPIPVIGDGQQTRDWTYVDDVLDAITLARKRWTSLHETFNISSGESHPVRTIAEKIARVTGTEVEYHIPFRPCDATKTRYVSNKNARTFLWEPKVSLNEGLTKTMDSWRMNHAPGRVSG
jgi:UDP-glucose 4-epimerase